MKIQFLITFVCLLMILNGLSAAAQHADQPQTTYEETTQPQEIKLKDAFKNSSIEGDKQRQLLIKKLLNTNVDTIFDHKPVREVIEELKAVAQFPIIARYSDDKLGYGIDPETPIILEEYDMSLLEVMELILEQCKTPVDTCTWQIRNGYVELGTRARLSVPAACHTRTYEIRDLLFEPTDYNETRKRAEEIALELVEFVVTTIEPDLWDYGQELYGKEEPAEESSENPNKQNNSSNQVDPNTTPTNKDPKTKAPLRKYVLPKKPAIIRYWRDVLIVHAPDFIHRQLGGYQISEKDNSNSNDDN